MSFISTDNYLPAFIQTWVLLSFDSPGQRWSLHFLTSSPVPSHCCPVTAAPWHTRARLCQPPSQDLEQPLHGPQGFHWPLAKTESLLVRNTLRGVKWAKKNPTEYQLKWYITVCNFHLMPFELLISVWFSKIAFLITFNSFAIHAFSL